MKKVLMGTTALVAMGTWAVSPAMAEEEKIKIAVGGYFESYVSYTSQDFDDAAIADTLPFTVRREGEIHFSGETALDNGLTIGVNVQMEGVAQGSEIDESYIYFSGDFGKVIVGGENSAASLMGYASPGLGLGANSPGFYLFNNGFAVGTFGGVATGSTNTAQTGSYVGLSGDANKLSYFTPRISGFQLGLSYTPNDEATPADGRQNGGLALDDQAGDISDFIGVGLNFVNSFNGFDVAVAGVYERGDAEANTATSDDAQKWLIGANLGFAGFTIGGSYGMDNNATAGSADTTAWDAGIQYVTGPWGVSIQYYHAEREFVGVATDDEHDLIELGGSYDLGPGVVVNGGIQRVEDDGAAASDRSDGWAVAVGTKLSF